MRRAVLAVLVSLAGLQPACAGGTESTGTAIAVALPLLAGGYTVYKRDWTGLAQLSVDTITTVGTAYAIKQFVREQRPDKSDWKSFPSDTSALAFAPAQFLWDRYGWEYGVPAYAVAGYVGWTRIDARKHRWHDVAASAGLAFVASKIFTTRYRAKELRYGVAPMPGGGVYASLDYKF
jgi:membrane-associated phospholipid phosphatase